MIVTALREDLTIVFGQHRQVNYENGRMRDLLHLGSNLFDSLAVFVYSNYKHTSNYIVFTTRDALSYILFSNIYISPIST